MTKNAGDDHSYAVIASDQRERGNLTVVDGLKDGEIASLRSQ